MILLPAISINSGIRLLAVINGSIRSMQATLVTQLSLPSKD